MSEWGRESVVFLEIDQPFCTRTYGSAPCTAALGTTGNRKCYNTRKTCQDSANYVPGTLTLRFARQQLDLNQYGPVIPCLLSVATSPLVINLGGMNRSMAASGQREAVTVMAQDFQHSDQQVDKYRAERITGAASLLITGGDAAAGDIDKLTLEADHGDIVGKYLFLTAGAGSVQNRQVVGLNGLVAQVFPRWKRNDFTYSEDFTNAVWSVGDAVNPKLPNTTEIKAPDGTYTACKWVLNQTAGVNRSFGNGTTSNAVPGRRDVFSFDVFIPSSNSANPLRAYMYCANGLDIPTDFVNLNALPRDKWTRVEYAHTWNDSAGGAIQAQFHANAPDTVGDRMYVWHPQLELGVSEAGDYIGTTSAAVATPSATTDYEVRDAFDPYERGTFWGKFLARNPYFGNYRARIITGNLGDAIADMDVRYYVIDRIEMPVEGQLKITLKDIFSLVERRKAVAPLASLGELAADITSGAGSATLFPSGIGNSNYPASGEVAIGREAMTFTRSGDTMTLTLRGAYGTTADAHKDEDLVQLILRYAAKRVHEILYDLLINYTGIDASEIDYADWVQEGDKITDQFTANIAEPTPVLDLIGELLEHAGATLWPDITTGKIIFRALRAGVAVRTIDDDAWIIDGSLSLKPLVEQRISQVHVYYGQFSPTEDLEDRRNYRSRVVTPDLAAEDTTQHGTPAIRTVYSRWIGQFGRQNAEDLGERLLVMFRDPPVEATFDLHSNREGLLTVADYIKLRVAEWQDDTGAVDEPTLAITAIERNEDTLAITAQQVKFTAVTGDDSVRELWLDTEALDVNLRSVHDEYFATPTNQTVIFYVQAVIGASSPTIPAIRTGDWPGTLTLLKVVVDTGGRVQGCGGGGGTGGSSTGPVLPTAGATGGTAFKAEVAVSIDNTNGKIYGGGGGGGGGGLQYGPGYYTAAGGGGGGGAGRNGGASGPGGWKFGTQVPSGAPGTLDAGGVGGSGTDTIPGGNGGGPGQDGAAGSGSTYGGAAGGTKGKYAEGNSLITWIATGDRLGGVS